MIIFILERGVPMENEKNKQNTIVVGLKKSAKSEKDMTAKIANEMEMKAYLAKPLPEWRTILARECQVYVLGENYIAKRFDQINFKYVEEKEAIQIVANNIYALLRTKYFPRQTEEIDDKIRDIVSNFTRNIMTTLIKVSLTKDPDMVQVSFLPDGCIAFKNGVYDFIHTKWLFKYKVIKMPQIGNKMYLYSNNYLIMWYMDFEFQPIEDLDINHIKLHDMVALFQTMCEYRETRSMCFELMYNIAHDERDIFDEDRFMHICEIMGYLLLQSFSQHFVMLIGTGSNGKNSLFDGCFTSHIVPAITTNSLEDIETDRFITGSLLNRSHNICLETSPIVHKESKTIKLLTGSMFQTIEQKGVQKFSGFINAKFMFSSNDQDNTKFSDNSTGFRRRMNLFEIYYTWDPQKRFLKKGDYYDTTFSEDLRELKTNVINAIVFCYFGMYGMIHATKNFTSSFKFTSNDWSQAYADIDTELKAMIEKCGLLRIKKWFNSKMTSDSDAQLLLYDNNGKRLCASDILASFGYTGIEGLLSMFKDDDAMTTFFNDNDVYISTKLLKNIIGYADTTGKFNAALKKIYKTNYSNFKPLNANVNYIKCSLRRDRLKIIEAN